MLGNSGCGLVASRYGVTPVILLAVIDNRSSAKAKWFVQKVASLLVRPRRIQSLSVLIVCLTCPLALLLLAVIWWWTIPRLLHSYAKLPTNSAQFSVWT